MADASKDTGVIQALAQRLETQRLPWALALKEQVDRGETLSRLDIETLTEVFEDAQRIRPLVDRHPEWQPVVMKMLSLYQEITTTALENEKAAGGSQ